MQRHSLLMVAAACGALCTALVPASASAGWLEIARTVVDDGADVGRFPAAAVQVGMSGAPPSCDLCPSPNATETVVAYADWQSFDLEVRRRVVIDGDDPGDADWLPLTTFIAETGFFNSEPRIVADDFGGVWVSFLAHPVLGNSESIVVLAEPVRDGEGDCGSNLEYLCHELDAGTFRGGAPITIQYDDPPTLGDSEINFVHVLYSLNGGLWHTRLQMSTNDVDVFPVGGGINQETGEIEYEDYQIRGRFPDAVGRRIGSGYGVESLPAVTASVSFVGARLYYKQFSGFDTPASWGPPTQLHNNYVRPSLALRFPVVGVGEGEPAVAWTPLLSGAGQLAYRERGSNAIWMSVEHPPDAEDADYPSLSFNNYFEPHIAFEDESDDAVRLTTRRESQGGPQWQTPETLGFGLEPELVYDYDQGTFAALYYDLDVQGLVAVDGVWI